MKRPQSAKQVRNYWAQISSDEGVVKDSSKPFLRVNNKPLMNVVSSNNDFSRLLPKRIQQDKQRLYCETLQLKSSLNEVIEENHRLKTKIAILQREKDRRHKKQDQFQRSSTTASKAKIVQKEQGILVNLKKLVRQNKQESQNYKKELIKLKKSLRYTKLNEIEVEKQTIYEQNRSLAKIIQRLQAELGAQLNRSEENQNLAHRFQNTVSKLQQIQELNEKYEEMLQQLQMKNREVSDKMVVLEQKCQRDLAVQRRKVDLLTKQNEALRRQNRQINQKAEQERKKANNAKKTVRPASSHPQSYTTNTKTHEQHTKSNLNKQKEIALQKHVKLQNELQQAKKKLAVSENQLKEQLKYNSNTLNLSNQPFQLELTKNQIGQLSANTQKLTNNDKNSKNQVSYKSNNSKNPTQAKKGQKKSQIMQEISQLLTYRMKYNRYTFSELKNDIQATPLALFTYQDLLTMLTDEPFSLNSYYATEFLKNTYGKPKIGNNQQIESNILIQSLRNAIEEFELIDEHQQEGMLYKIAECLTKKRQQLLSQFAKLKVKNKCVNKKQICEILQRCGQLNSKEIDLVISYVSMSCQSLQKINFQQVLDKFHLNNGSKSMQNSQSQSKQIQEEQELSLGEDEGLDQDEPVYGEDQII